MGMQKIHVDTLMSQRAVSPSASPVCSPVISTEEGRNHMSQDEGTSPGGDTMQPQQQPKAGPGRRCSVNEVPCCCGDRHSRDQPGASDKGVPARGVTGVIH